jgi:hypothetical protein
MAILSCFYSLLGYGRDNAIGIFRKFPFPFHWLDNDHDADRPLREWVIEMHIYPHTLSISFYMWHKWILKHIFMYHILFARNCSHNSWGKLWHQWCTLSCTSASNPIIQYRKLMWNASQWIIFLDMDRDFRSVQWVPNVSGLWPSESIQKKFLTLWCEYLCRSEELRKLAVQIGVIPFA